jgi:hypothetical protein
MGFAFTATGALLREQDADAGCGPQDASCSHYYGSRTHGLRTGCGTRRREPEARKRWTEAEWDGPRRRTRRGEDGFGGHVAWRPGMRHLGI